LIDHILRRYSNSTGPNNIFCQIVVISLYHNGRNKQWQLKSAENLLCFPRTCTNWWGLFRLFRARNYGGRLGDIATSLLVNCRL